MAKSVAQISLVSITLVNISRIMSDFSDDGAYLSRPGDIVDDVSVVELDVPVVSKPL